MNDPKINKISPGFRLNLALRQQMAGIAGQWGWWIAMATVFVVFHRIECSFSWEPGLANVFWKYYQLEVNVSHDTDLHALAEDTCASHLSGGESSGMQLQREYADCRAYLLSSLEHLAHEVKHDAARQLQRRSFDMLERTRWLRHELDITEAARVAMSACGADFVGRAVAFNPEDPSVAGCVLNDPIFRFFPPRAVLPLEGFVTDFLGIRTSLDIDCRKPSVVPSRRFECERYMCLQAVASNDSDNRGGQLPCFANPTSLWDPTAAWYPAVDEEYFEWIALLTAVVASEQDSTFVSIEIGAGHAPWTVRAAVAHRLLYTKPMHVVAMEANPRELNHLRNQLALNDVSHNITVWRAAASA